MATAEILSLTRDFLAEFDITQPNEATGEAEPAAGLTTIVYHFAATKGGAAIDPSLVQPATERTGVPGRYYAVFDVVSMIAALFPTYENKVIYLVVNKSGDISEEPYAYKVKRFGA